MRTARFAANNLKVVPDSKNRKLGGAASTYRPIGETGTGTCPTTCAVKNICYAKTGLTRFSERLSDGSYGDLEAIFRANKSLVRHHVSGDCFLPGDRLDVKYAQMLLAFHKAHPEITGWIYTHRIQAWDEAGITADKIPVNLTVLASCDKEEDVEYAKLHGWKYARVSLLSTRNGDRREGEVYCPYDRAKDHGRPITEINVTCSRCKLCFKGNWKVVFSAQFPGSHNQREIQRKKAISLRVLA